MTARIFIAPEPSPFGQRPSIFLAGSIEMGVAEDWQKRLTERLNDLPIFIYNPRRPKFATDLRQSKDEPAFREQVEWELNHLAKADIIALYLAPDTKSPISLLELGLFAATGKVIACCPPGFWRKGNVEIVCERAGIPLHEDFDGFAAAVRAKMEDECLKPWFVT